MRRIIVPMLAILALAACHDDDDVLACVGYYPAIAITVRDSASGNLYTGMRRVILDNGVSVDSLTRDGAPVSPEITMGSDPGIYTITVRSGDAYAEWKKSGVVVTAGRCGTNTVHLAALLQRRPADLTSDFSANFGPKGEFTLGMARVRFVAGSFTLDVGGADLGKAFDVPTSGTANVRFSLVAGASDTLAKKDFTFELQPAWRFSVYAIVAARAQPGCLGMEWGTPGMALRLPSGGMSTDSLYVAAMDIPKGAVC